VAADIDASFGDIVDNLEFGAMLAYRGEGDRWAVMFDAIYMDLGADDSRTAGPIRIDAEVGMQQTALEADFGRRVTELTTAFVGLRYIDISADVEVARTGPLTNELRSAGGSESWLDPVIGFTTRIPLSDIWSLDLRGDIGGFGVGSDFSWQAIATVRWQASTSIHVIGGYRYIDIDFEDGSGSSLFQYDMALSGPGLGVAFSF
jgi:hypothetical protein